MKSSKTSTGLMLAALAFAALAVQAAPTQQSHDKSGATVVARHGADDPAGDDRGGRRGGRNSAPAVDQYTAAEQQMGVEILAREGSSGGQRQRRGGER